MNKIIILLLVCAFQLQVFSQVPNGYYDKASGLTGDALKEALHKIIDNHNERSYNAAKQALKEADEDPNNQNQFILVYTGRCISKSTKFGVSGNDVNREHVWAKSHGNFGTHPPAGSDLHNLKPCDASVNSDRSNKNFDEGGNSHQEATGCRETSKTWEPRDEVKGDIARIMFYMATRYEGDKSGEPDLELVDELTFGKAPVFGVLSTLLKWHKQDPVDNFERHRNDVIYGWQNNRNPYIDHPEYVELIWGNNPIKFIEIEKTPETAVADKETKISVKINKTVDEVKLYWGKTEGNFTNTITMEFIDNKYVATIPPMSEGESVYYKIEASVASEKNTVSGSYTISVPTDIIPVAQIQGTTNISPKNGKIVNVKGIVTAVFGSIFYIQDNTTANSGIAVYKKDNDVKEGDELIVTGKVVEYFNLTEITDVTKIQRLASGKIIAPVNILLKDVGEKYEGMLVRIKNVNFSDAGKTIAGENKYYEIKDEENTEVVYIRKYSPLVGKTLPTESINLMAIIGQYEDRYQLLVRTEADFQAITHKPPVVVSVKAESERKLTILFNKELKESSIIKVENYIFENINITKAELDASGKKVILTLGNITKGKHNLKIKGIEDLEGNIMQDAEIQFYYNFTDMEEYEKEIKIYPNPSESEIFINSYSEDNKVDIYNMSGVKIFSKKINNGKTNINLPQGIYTIIVSEKNKEIKKQRIIINGK